MTFLKRLTLLALVGLLMSACSSTTVKNSWVKPGYSDKVENVYLVGIAKEEDFRRLFEEAFKRKLTGQGVRAQLPRLKGGAQLADEHAQFAEPLLLARADSASGVRGKIDEEFTRTSALSHSPTIRSTSAGSPRSPDTRSQRTPRARISSAVASAGPAEVR